VGPWEQDLLVERESQVLRIKCAKHLRNHGFFKIGCFRLEGEVFKLPVGSGKELDLLTTETGKRIGVEGCQGTMTVEGGTSFTDHKENFAHKHLEGRGDKKPGKFAIG